MSPALSYRFSKDAFGCPGPGLMMRHHRPFWLHNGFTFFSLLLFSLSLAGATPAGSGRAFSPRVQTSGFFRKGGKIQRGLRV
ncbi:hypothetical protein V2G26_017433 [Clonostachys chloroleuca]